MSRLPLCASSSLHSALVPLITRGACLVFPSPQMPVPIPLNECRPLSAGRLLWATSHTPYGSARPCVGLLEFAGCSIASESCVFFGPDGHELARIVCNSQLRFPVARAGRLHDEQQRHLRRAAEEPAYAHRWARRFREAAATIS